MLYYAAVVKEPDLNLTQAEIHHQLADRQRVLKDNEALKQTAKALIRDKEELEQRLQKLQIVMKRQAQEAQRWREQYQAMMAQMRSLPLTQIAFELGLDLDSSNNHKWRNEEHVINITGSKFYDWKLLKGGGGAIDLVMHLQQCSFTNAVSWLMDHFGEPAVLQTVTEQITVIVTEKPQQPFIPPAPHEGNWLPVREYLTRSRKLPASLVDKIYQKGLIYADERQNAVFVRRTLDGEVVGASLRGTVGENDFFEGLAYGSRRSQGWFYIVAGGKEEEPIQEAVLMESAIEALSYRTLYPPTKKTMILSINEMGYLPVNWLANMKEIVIGFKQDQAGEEKAQRLIQKLSQTNRQVPVNKDWNADLQTYLRRLKHQLIQDKMQQIHQEESQTE